MMRKTCKNHKLLLVTELISCNNTKVDTKSCWVFANGTRVILKILQKILQNYAIQAARYSVTCIEQHNTDMDTENHTETLNL